MIFSSQISHSTQIHLCLIDENSGFYKTNIPIPDTITHPAIQKQFVTTRFLLETYAPLQIDPKKLLVSDAGKPYYEGNPFYFNISHSRTVAGIILSKDNTVALDIEHQDRTISAHLKQRYLSPYELDLIQHNYPHFSYIEILIWCCKETIYKYLPELKLDFLAITMETMNVENKFVELKVNSTTYRAYFFEYQHHWVVYMG